ncbi:MAG: serine protease [Acetobacteraceae bacterium]
MPPWVANLIGLALGFTIAGEGVYILLASRETEPPAPVAAPAPPVQPRVAAPAPPSLAPPAVLPPPALQPPAMPPAEMPRLAPPPQAGTLPRVVYPERPPPGAERKGAGVTGTGFFVASDGTLLTAAHVVTGCAQTRIASQWVKPTQVQTLAIDATQDIAVLRAPSTRPPALLAIGRPAGAGGRLFVLGYPASGGPLVPTETWGDLQNALFQPAPVELTDPRKVIWAAAPAVGHGFSGGPMLDPRNGTVVGIVRGMVDSTKLHAVRAAIPASGMVIGPGSQPLTALLRQERADGDAQPAPTEQALDTARRATVHVFCLY